jgi:hypothetical protein
MVFYNSSESQAANPAKKIVARVLGMLFFESIRIALQVHVSAHFYVVKITLNNSDSK